LVVWATLRFARTGLAIFQPGFVEVVYHPCSPLALSRRMQDFALRANTVVLLWQIRKCARRKPVRQVGAPWHLFIPHGPQKIDLSPGHLLDILSCGIATIGHHPLRLFLQPLF
jgi:hypothetical protein